MMSAKVLAEGAALMARAWAHQPMDEGRIELYREVCGELTDEQWSEAVKFFLSSDREFAPTPGMILQHARKAEVLPVAAASAEAFEAILDEYSSGRHLSGREVEERFGKAARCAFSAAGGRATFDVVGGEGQERTRSFALKNFTAAWAEAADSDPASVVPRLEAGAPVRQLTSGQPPPLTPDQIEWRKRYDERYRRPPTAGPGNTGHAKLSRLAGPRTMPAEMSESEWAERVERLKEQAAKIQGEPC